MNRILGWFAVSAAAALAAIGAAAPAQATPGPLPVVSECNKGWYVNGDEAALLPKQVPAGFVFDGPSIVHHSTALVAIKDVPAVGFTATNVTGNAPLFKLETTEPYSTVNVLADGKAWSSKIPTGKGSQNEPVSLADLAALSPYTEKTRVFSFGVGYANDTGNKATVTAITYDTTYGLACTPPTQSPSPTPTATGSPTPTASATGTPTGAPTATGTTAAPPAAGPSLPVTGSPIRTAGIIGAGLLLIGAALYVGTRYRRHTFHS